MMNTQFDVIWMSQNEIVDHSLVELDCQDTQKREVALSLEVAMIGVIQEEHRNNHQEYVRSPSVHWTNEQEHQSQMYLLQKRMLQRG